MNLDHLPEDCFAHILSFTSPGDACRCSSVSWSFRTMADLDSMWEKFLPFDHAEILFRLVCPITYSSNKELFIRFAEVAELRTIWWLEICGIMNTQMLSLKTIYGA
ncbi:unnamed protein product [Prunus brigantina]